LVRHSTSLPGTSSCSSSSIGCELRGGCVSERVRCACVTLRVVSVPVRRDEHKLESRVGGRHGAGLAASEATAAAGQGERASERARGDKAAGGTRLTPPVSNCPLVAHLLLLRVLNTVRVALPAASSRRVAMQRGCAAQQCSGVRTTAPTRRPPRCTLPAPVRAERESSRQRACWRAPDTAAPPCPRVALAARAAAGVSRARSSAGDTQHANDELHEWQARRCLPATTHRNSGCADRPCRVCQELLRELRAAAPEALPAAVAAQRSALSTRFLLWLGAQATAAEAADDDAEGQALGALCARLMAVCDRCVA
jgi:hypothetical protein